MLNWVKNNGSWEKKIKAAG